VQHFEVAGVLTVEAAEDVDAIVVDAEEMW